MQGGVNGYKKCDFLQSIPYQPDHISRFRVHVARITVIKFNIPDQITVIQRWSSCDRCRSPEPSQGCVRKYSRIDRGIPARPFRDRSEFVHTRHPPIRITSKFLLIGRIKSIDPRHAHSHPGTRQTGPLLPETAAHPHQPCRMMGNRSIIMQSKNTVRSSGCYWIRPTVHTLAGIKRLDTYKKQNKRYGNYPRIHSGPHSL